MFSYLKQAKCGQIYMGMGQMRRVVPERQETNKMGSRIAPIYCLEKVSKLHPEKTNAGSALWNSLVEEME